MRATVRVPGDFRIPTRFFGKFSAKDLGRIGLPAVPGLIQAYQQPSLGALLWMFAGLLAGLVWYGWKPYKHHLDALGYNAARWLLGQRVYETDSVDTNQNHLILEDGTAVALLEVSPTNLEMKTEAEQAALHATYKELFETISYPVHVHSVQSEFDLEAHAKHIKEQDVPREELQEDYVEFCEEFAENRLSSTRHIITVRVAPDSLDWVQNRLMDEFPSDLLDDIPVEDALDRLPVEDALERLPAEDILEKIPVETEPESEQETLVSELNSRCREVADAIDSADLTADRITGTELHRLTSKFQYQCTNPGIKHNSRPQDGIGEHRRTIYISELPSSLEIGWLVQLLRVEGLVDVTQTIHPKDPADSTKKLQRLSGKLNAEIDSFLQQGHRGTNKLEGLLDDVEWFLDLLADREAQPVEHGIYITAHGPDRKTCEQAFKQVCNRLQTMQIEFKQPVLRTDQAAFTDSPLHGDRLDEKIMMPTGSAASGFPFATQDLDQRKGVIHGIDTGDETPILLDRFSWSSHSMARMGMVGSGKSYAAKLEILRSYLSYPDLQIIVVDPKQEYSRIIRNLGGTVHTLGDEYSFDDEVVGFQVAKRGQDENVARLAELVQDIYDYCSQDAAKTLVVIDEARILMNDDSGRRVLNDFVLEGRDTNTAVTLISQNASHFTHCREGRGILDNMPGKVFMRHDRVPDSVVDYFDLSQQEKQKLFELKTGTDASYSEALVKVSGQTDSRIRIGATSQEHAIIESGEIE